MVKPSTNTTETKCPSIIPRNYCVLETGPGVIVQAVLVNEKDVCSSMTQRNTQTSLLPSPRLPFFVKVQQNKTHLSYAIEKNVETYLRVILQS